MDDLIQSLPKLLRVAGESDEVLEAAAFVAWRRIAGEGLRAQAVPFRLHRKTLTVAVADRTWQHNLEAMCGQMLFRLNSLLGSPVVTFIEFRIDAQTIETARRKQTVKLNDDNGKQQQRRRAALAHAATLNKAATQIKDEDLRRKFLLAAGSCLEAKERNGIVDDE